MHETVIPPGICRAQLAYLSPRLGDLMLFSMLDFRHWTLVQRNASSAVCPSSVKAIVGG